MRVHFVVYSSVMSRSVWTGVNSDAVEDRSWSGAESADYYWIIM